MAELDTSPFDADREEQIREEASRLLKDEGVNTSLVAMIAGYRLVALSSMVLNRTLREEQASEGVFEFIRDAARFKAANAAAIPVPGDGVPQGSIDLKSLMQAITDFVPGFVHEEMSRLVSETRTSALLSAAQKPVDSPCQVAVHDASGAVAAGEMIVILGPGEKVGNAIEELLGVARSYVYSTTDEPVDRAEILYLFHKFGGDHGCQDVPMGMWRGFAKDRKSWSQASMKLIQSYRHMVISNINLAGCYPPPSHRTMASQVKQTIATISRGIQGTQLRVIAGAFVPASEPEYRQEIVSCVAKRPNVTLWQLDE